MTILVGIIGGSGLDNPELFLNEAADLLFHYLLLLNAKGVNLQKVTDLLQERHRTA